MTRVNWCPVESLRMRLLGNLSSTQLINSVPLAINLALFYASTHTFIGLINHAVSSRPWCTGVSMIALWVRGGGSGCLRGRGGLVIESMPEMDWFYTFLNGFCEGCFSPQTPLLTNIHAPFHAVGLLKTRLTPTPGLVGAFVGKLSLGGSDGGSRPGWGMAIGEIWHTSRLWVSIDFIYNSDAQITMISYKSTPLTPLSRICLYVRNIK